MCINIIELCITFISVIASTTIAILMYRISKRQSDFLEKVEIDKNTPYLYPAKNFFCKEKWVRYYKGGVKVVSVKSFALTKN